jgi:hypothetical protein
MRGNINRRKVLKTAGIAGSMAFTSGIVSVSPQEDSPTTQSEGIDEKLPSLIKSGEIKKASTILNEYGIPNACTKKAAHYNDEQNSLYTSTAELDKGETISETTISDKEETVRPMDEWDKGHSEISRHTYHRNKKEDLWGTSINWYLGDGGNMEGQAESDEPLDGAQISFSIDDWDHKSKAVSADPDWDNNPGAKDSKGSKVDKKMAKGFAVKYDDPPNPYFVNADPVPRPDGSAGTSVYRVDDSREHTLYGSYTHTWSTVQWNGLNISYNSIPISFGTGWGAHNWDVNIDHIVKPNNEVEADRY